MIYKFSILNGAKCTYSGIFQNYLVFIPAKRYIDSNGMSKENIEKLTKSDGNFEATVINHHLLPDTSFNRPCLRNNIHINKKVAIIDVSYTVNRWLKNLNTDFTLKYCLFWSLELIKNDDPEKYKYSGYDIWFDSRSEFSSTNKSMGKNVIFLALKLDHLCILIIWGTIYLNSCQNTNTRIRWYDINSRSFISY